MLEKFAEKIVGVQVKYPKTVILVILLSVFYWSGFSPPAL